jgi:hypothetical protein
MSEVVGAAKPLVEAGKAAAAGYAKSPGKAIVDVGAAHLGLPPPYATYEGFQGVKNMLGAAKDTAGNLGDVFSKLPPGTDKVAAPFVNSLRSADQANLMKLINEQGLEKGFKNFQPPPYMNQAGIDSLNAVRNSFPGVMQRIGNAMAPFVRGASKVLAPIGAAVEGTQAYRQAQQGDYTGAAISGLSAASMFNPVGLLAQPGLAMMQSANRNLQSQTPAQRNESLDSALRGQTPGMYGDMSIPQYSIDEDSKKLNMAIRMKAAKKVLP